MKRILFYGLLLCVGFTTTSAQTTRNKKATARQTTQQKSSNAQIVQDTGSFTSASTNQAFDNNTRLSIADPVVKTLNYRANGYNVPSGSSGMIGMPKSAYGFANGKLLLRPTTATSPGTIYGSGAVGTGTAITGTGTGENIPGVNGKNPYAGSSLWGIKPVPQQSPNTTIQGNNSNKQKTQ